jgi:hypothetical protein
MNRKRALLYAVLALAVPLPALAIETGSGTTSLGVEASLGGCGIGDAAITCRIDASFNRVADAEYYTASVTAPDGSVSDLGTVAAGGGEGRTSAGLSVRYAGNGEYTVTITAWGYDERGRADPVGTDDAGTDGDATAKGEGDLEAVNPPVEPTADSEQDVEDPAPAEEAPPLEDEVEPECPEPETPLPPAEGLPTEEPPPGEPPATVPPAGEADASASEPLGDEVPPAEVGAVVPQPCEAPQPEPDPAPVP